MLAAGGASSEYFSFRRPVRPAWAQGEKLVNPVPYIPQIPFNTRRNTAYSHMYKTEHHTLQT
jgi:hypothetical protein